MDFEFLLGHWTCEVWGGEFKESWERSSIDILVGVGSHSVDGHVTLREEMTIERIGGRIALRIALGSANGELKPPVHFMLTALTDSTAQFENPENDFPMIIMYSMVDQDRLHCRIAGGGDPVDFNFIRSSLSKMTGN